MTLPKGYRLLGQELRIGSACGYFGTGLALSLTGLTIAIGAPLFSTADKCGSDNKACTSTNASSIRWVPPLGAPLFGNDAQDWFGTAVASVEPTSLPVVGGPLIVMIGATHCGTKYGYIQTSAFEAYVWEHYGERFDINHASHFGPAVSSITGSFGSSMSPVQTESGLPRQDQATKRNTSVVTGYNDNEELDQWSLLADPNVEGNDER
jgi:hypothetical protein